MVLEMESASTGLAVPAPKVAPEAAEEAVVEATASKGVVAAGSGAADEEAPASSKATDGKDGGSKDEAAAAAPDAEASASKEPAAAAANGAGKGASSSATGTGKPGGASNGRGPPFQPYAGIPSFTQLKATNLTDWPPGRGLTFIRPCPSGTASLEKLAMLQSCPQILMYIQGFSGADWIEATFTPQPCVRITATTQMPGGKAAAETILRLSDEMILQWLHRFDPSMPIWAMFVAPSMLSGLLVGKLAVNLKTIEATSQARVWAAPRDPLAQYVSFFICSNNYESTRSAYAMLEARALNQMEVLAATGPKLSQHGPPIPAPTTPPAPQPATPTGANGSGANNVAVGPAPQGGNEEGAGAAPTATKAGKKKKKKNKGNAAVAAAAGATGASGEAAGEAGAEAGAAPVVAPAGKGTGSGSGDSDDNSTDTEPSTQPISRAATASPAPVVSSQAASPKAGKAPQDAPSSGKEAEKAAGGAASPAKKQEEASA